MRPLLRPIEFESMNSHVEKGEVIVKTSSGSSQRTQEETCAELNWSCPVTTPRIRIRHLICAWGLLAEKVVLTTRPFCALLRAMEGARGLYHSVKESAPGARRAHFRP